LTFNYQSLGKSIIRCRSGVVFTKLKLKWKFQMHISSLVLIQLPWNLAYLWKTEIIAFGIFTYVINFPKELCEYGPRVLFILNTLFYSKTINTLVPEVKSTILKHDLWNCSNSDETVTQFYPWKMVCEYCDVIQWYCILILPLMILHTTITTSDIVYQ